MNIAPIKNQRDYRSVLKRIEGLMTGPGFEKAEIHSISKDIVLTTGT